MNLFTGLDNILMIGGGFMEDLYVTVTGFANYYHKKPFAIGNVLICVKEPSNKYDSEAITVKLPIIGKVGYIANSPASIAGGTLSAGRIYDKVEDKFFVRVMFTTQSKVICKVEENSDGILEKEIQTQIEAAEEWLNDFSKGSIISNILRLSIPMTLAQLINVLYSIVDRIYIGRMGENSSLALTGVGVCLPIITIVIAFANLIGMGGAPLFSIKRGEGNEKEAEAILGNSVTLLVIFGLCLTVVGLIVKRPLLYLLGASENTIEYANSYITIYLLGNVFVMMSLGLNSFINAQGFGKTGMLTVVIGAVLNIILDPIFIYIMGVQGAALATVLSQLAASVWTFKFLTGKNTIIKIKLSAMRCQAKRVKKILVLGLSGFTMSVTNSAVQIACNVSLQNYGSDVYVGVMTIINSIREVLQMPVTGLGNGAQPIIGFNYGAGENGRVKEAIRYLAAMLIIYSTVAWFIILLIPKFLIGIFTADAALITAGVPSLHIYFFGFFLMAFMFTGQTVFVGIGKAKFAIFFSILRKGIVVIPLILLLPIWFGVNGVFLAEPISNLIGGLACFTTMYFAVYRKL